MACRCAILGWLLVFGIGLQFGCRESSPGAELSTAFEADRSEIARAFEDLPRSRSRLAVASRGRVRTSLRKADTARANGDLIKAQQHLRLARTHLRTAARQVREWRQNVRRLERLRKRVSVARAAAEKARAPEFASLEYREAKRLCEAALEHLEENDNVSLDQARKKFEQARDLFEDCRFVAEDVARTRRHLEDEKLGLAEVKKRAEAAGAAEEAAAGWISATRLERDARRLEEDRNWAAALAAYRLVVTGYNELLLDLQVVAETPERRHDGSAAPADQAPTPPRTLAQPLPPATGRGVPLPSTPLSSWIDEVSLPRCAETIEPADEVFLSKHLSLLSSVVQYDEATGAVYLDYTQGRDLRGDIEGPHNPARYLSFHDPFAPTGAPPSFSFQANTKGLFYLSVPLRDRVKVTWDTQIHTMDQNGSFGCIVFLDPKKKSFLFNDGVHLGAVQYGDPAVWLRRLGGRFGGIMNHWFEKRREVPMGVEFVPLALDAVARDRRRSEGRLSVTYDAGDVDEVTNAVTTKFRARGFVGFKWNRVRFQLKRLRVWGVLDKERALTLLRRELAEKDRRRGTGFEFVEPVTEGYGDDSHLTLAQSRRTRDCPR